MGKTSKRRGGSSVDLSLRTDEEKKRCLEHQQNRLLLLYHASKCPIENCECPETPLCAYMKQHWKHVSICKDKRSRCSVPHCVSSRVILSHFHKCKDVNCPTCIPLRKKKIADKKICAESGKNETIEFDVCIDPSLGECSFTLPKIKIRGLLEPVAGKKQEKKRKGIHVKTTDDSGTESSTLLHRIPKQTSEKKEEDNASGELSRTITPDPVKTQELERMVEEMIAVYNPYKANLSSEQVCKKFDAILTIGLSTHLARAEIVDYSLMSTLDMVLVVNREPEADREVGRDFGQGKQDPKFVLRTCNQRTHRS